MHGPLFQLFAVAAVTMGISHVIAKERIFAPLRAALGGTRTHLGFLVSCPLCISHWVAFALVPLTGAYHVDVVVGGWPGAALRWFLSSMLVVVLAAFLRVAFYFVDETQGLVRRRQKEVEVETEVMLHEREQAGERPRAH